MAGCSATNVSRIFSRCSSVRCSGAGVAARFARGGEGAERALSLFSSGAGAGASSDSPSSGTVFPAVCPGYLWKSGYLGQRITHVRAPFAFRSVIVPDTFAHHSRTVRVAFARHLRPVAPVRVARWWSVRTASPASSRSRPSAAQRSFRNAPSRRWNAATSFDHGSRHTESATRCQRRRPFGTLTPPGERG